MCKACMIEFSPNIPHVLHFSESLVVELGPDDWFKSMVCEGSDVSYFWAKAAKSPGNRNVSFPL